MNIRRIVIITLTLVGSLTFVSCNTLEGAGEDVEDAGESVQDAAE